MDPAAPAPPAAARDRVAIVAALATFALHVVANPHYGFFRDELYFIVCGRHPAFGYVDQPPLVPLLAAGSQLFGHSLVLLRAVAAAFAAGAVFVAVRLARELGGGRFAALLAALATALAPVLVSFGMKLSTDTPGLWLWPLAALYLVRLARGGDAQLWLGVGAAVGVALEAKYSALYFAVAFFVGLVLTPERRLLRSRWFAAGLGVATALALPSVVWQAAHGFPMLELLRNGQHGKNVVLSPGAYVAAELMITNPLLALVWVAGLAWLLASRAWRFVGLGYLVLLVAMIASHAKHYYPADVYPILFAAGGVAVERATAARRWWRPALVAVAIAAALVPLPYALPILPTPRFVAYDHAVGPVLHVSAARTEHGRPTALPQDWADMHGWPELAATVERVYRSLPPDERARAAIVADDYGQAAAIDFFGHDLPPALSGHNQYFVWGPRGFSGDVLIDVGGDCGAGTDLFRSATRAATFRAPWARESELPIMVCRGIRRPLQSLWPERKRYI